MGIALLLACSGGGVASPDAGGGGPDAWSADAFGADAAGSDANAIDALNADAAPPDAATRTVTGVITLRHVTLDGEVVVPLDLSQAEIEALMPPDFTSYPGAGQADGTFSIPGVPTGTYYLKIGRVYTVRSSDTIDHSWDLLGRSDAVEATISPTNLVFDVANLADWQEGDELQMFSAGSGTSGFRLYDGATNPPQVGDTALTAFTVDLASVAGTPMLIDGSAGDSLVLAQLETTSDGAHTYQAIGRVFEPGGFTIEDGASANLTGAFVDVPQTETLELQLDRGAFEAALRSVGPPDLGTYSLSVLGLHTLPEADTRGVYWDTADLIVFAPGWTTDISTVAGAWPYGDPYPQEWTRLVSAYHYTYRWVQVGTADPRPVYSILEVQLDRASVSAAAPIEPIIGPVVNPRVNGANAYGALSGIGLAPTISWDAPSTGTADAYRVDVQRYLDYNGVTAHQRIAIFQTAETSLVLPPGVLEAGEHYIFHISATSMPGVDLDATPGLFSIPEGYSVVATSLATP